MKCAITLLSAGVLAVALGASLKIEDESQVSPHNVGGDLAVSPHIVGGDLVQHLERPYTVRLRLRYNRKLVRYCGGVRLNRYWFITTAECLDQTKYDNLQILYPAANSENNYNKKEWDFVYLKRSIHPEYNNLTKDNNIGLFLCSSCLPIPDFRALPKLPRKSGKSGNSGPNAVVSGWTISEPDADVQEENTITSYNTTIVNNFLCQIAYFFRSVSSRHICASSWGGKGITKVDVGVPLVLREGSEQTLVGIASSIRPWTTILPLPTVFTKIEPYVEWITQETSIIKPS